MLVNCGALSCGIIVNRVETIEVTRRESANWNEFLKCLTREVEVERDITTCKWN
jgi:hypothetical protein